MKENKTAYKPRYLTPHTLVRFIEGSNPRSQAIPQPFAGVLFLLD
jgi:hypothetical protein